MLPIKNESGQLLTPDEVAELLAIPKSWIYGRHHSKTLPFAAIKVGVYLRFRECDVHEYIQQQIREASSNA